MRLILALALFAAAAPASAAELRFHALLSGKGAPDDTGSAATARAKIRVDTVRRRISVDLDVRGLTLDSLWDKLVAAPAGPIHFHQYLPDGRVVLALPLPYGANYRPTRTGFRVVMKHFDYESGAKLLNSTLDFDAFVTALRARKVILNIHTDAFNPGEIGGWVEAD